MEKEEEYDAKGAGTRRKEGTMCVHAAHVACQPAWQPGVDSLRLLPLPSQVKVRPRFSLSLSPSPSSLFSLAFLLPPSSFSFSLFSSVSVSPVSYAFFPLFLRKRVAATGETKRKGIFLFIKLQPLTWSTPTHGPTCGWIGIATGEPTTENALVPATLKPYRATGFSRGTFESLDYATWSPDKSATVITAVY